MKTPIIITLLATLIGASAFADDYSVFRVCQDQRVIHTSDGADAGHVEYIVVDPSNRQVISTVVSGGVLGDRFVAVPYESLRFSGGHEITLTEITRERLVSAPVIERTQISAAVIAPTVIQRTTNHFSMRTDVNSERTVDQGTRDANGRGEDPRVRGEAAARGEAKAGSEAAARSGAAQNAPTGERNANQSPAATTNGREQNAPNARENAERNTPAANAEKNGARDENANSSRPEARTPREQQREQQNPNASAEKAQTNPPASAKEQREQPARNASEESKAAESKAAAAKRDAQNAKAQGEESKREAQGAAERKETEAAHSKKPAEERPNSPAESATKHAPKKAQEPAGEDKRKEDSSPR